jgi:hypothetical protein
MCSPKKAKAAAATEATELSRRTFKAGSAVARKGSLADCSIGAQCKGVGVPR